MSFDLRSYFTMAMINRYLKELQPLKTPVIDTVFTNRPLQPLPVIAADLLTPVLHEMPLVRRGGRSIPVGSESGSIAAYEPFPLRPDKFVKASDINNLKLMGQSSIELWARNWVDYLRRIVRKTTEAMAAVSLSGTLAWPVKLEGGGFENYSVVFGSTLSVTPTTLWSASGAKIKDVFKTLTEMHEAVQEYGYGSQIEFWCASDAFLTLFSLAEAVTTTVTKSFGVDIKVDAAGITIGDYLIKRRAEKYRHPQTGVMTPIVPAKTLRLVALDAGHFMPYAAVDDLDANLQATPFFTKPIKMDNPSGYQIVGESKPFPVPNVHGICDAVVIS